jgi:hypothetical protein
MTYSPRSEVMAMAWALVPSWVAVTVTPGSTAPELSRTVPTIDPVSIWAAAGTTPASTRPSARPPSRLAKWLAVMRLSSP